MKVITVYDLPDAVFQARHNHRFRYDPKDVSAEVEEEARNYGLNIARWVLNDTEYEPNFSPIKLSAIPMTWEPSSPPGYVIQMAREMVPDMMHKAAMDGSVDIWSYVTREWDLNVFIDNDYKWKADLYRIVDGKRNTDQWWTV